MFRKRHLAIFCLLLAAGCGGEPSETSTTPAANLTAVSFEVPGMT